MSAPTFDRPLTRDEREYITLLAVAVIAYRTGCTAKVAATALDATDCRLEVSTTEACVVSNDVAIVKCERDWLAFHTLTRTPVDLQDFDR